RPARGHERVPGEARGAVRSEPVKVRRATIEDVPTLVHLFQELERLQRDWRVFTPRPGFYDEVGLKYRKAMGTDQAVVLVAEDDRALVGMAYGRGRVSSRC